MTGMISFALFIIGLVYAPWVILVSLLGLWVLTFRVSMPTGASIALSLQRGKSSTSVTSVIQSRLTDIFPAQTSEHHPLSYRGARYQSKSTSTHAGKVDLLGKYRGKPCTIHSPGSESPKP
jgi:hypothetical protein